MFLVNQFSKFESHAKNQYHLTSLTRMSELIERYKYPEVAVDTQLNKRLQHQMECNQKVIESLLKVVIFCGKQGLAYRGHRDDLIDFSDLEVESSHKKVILLNLSSSERKLILTFIIIFRMPLRMLNTLPKQYKIN